MTTAKTPNKKQATRRASPKAVDTYESELAELLSGKEPVLIGQRTCGQDGRPWSQYADKDFRWPQSGWVVCNDWKPTNDCGNGLHFCAVGAAGTDIVRDEGSTIIADGPDPRWQIVIAMVSDSVRIKGEKHKAQRVFVVDLDGSKEAMSAWLSARGIVGHHMVATAGDRGTATAGDDGTATAGDDGTATAGYGGTATAGDDGTATAGDDGTATAGYGGTATVKNYGAVKTGDNGIVVTTWIDRNGSKQVQAWTVGNNRDLKANTQYRVVDGVATEIK